MRGATSGQNCWGQDFSIDIWANLYGITKPSTHTSCTVQLLDVTIGANNRITGLGYDNPGNLTNDGLLSYSYDAENRITTTAGVSYTYDGDGRRVKKSNGKIYWYGTSGKVLLETDSQGNMSLLPANAQAGVLRIESTKRVRFGTRV